LRVRTIYGAFRRDRFERSIDQTEALERGDEIGASGEDDDIGIDQPLSIELCKHSAGIVTAMGVTQLAAGTIASYRSRQRSKDE